MQKKLQNITSNYCRIENLPYICKRNHKQKHKQKHEIMAYINKEEAAVIRKTIKNEFPAKEGWKFSIVVDHYSSLDISVITAPFDMNAEENKAQRDEVLDRLRTLGKGENWFDHSDSMTDYFHVKHYVSVRVGKWNKDFTVAEPKAAKKPAAPAVEVEKIDYSQYCDETLATTYEPIVEVLEDVDAVEIIEIENEIEDSFDYWAVLDEKPAAPVVEKVGKVEVVPVVEVETVDAKPQPATEEEIYNTIETIIREDSNSLSGVTISLYKGVTFIGCFKTIFGAKKIASYMGVGNYNLIGDSSYKYNNSFRVM